ncbi:MAG: DUF1905 domain-containing protein [Sphingomonas sp.]|nr:DUF1905 domain-containing protein [Sphingomonas sp.]
MSAAGFETIEAEAVLWRWSGVSTAGAWYFLTIEGEAADAIRVAALTGQWIDRGKGGFGSAKVTATIGETGWRTSVFPHKASGGWLLPVKKAVRQAEGLNEGDRVRVRLTL